MGVKETLDRMYGIQSGLTPGTPLHATVSNAIDDMERSLAKISEAETGFDSARSELNFQQGSFSLLERQSRSLGRKGIHYRQTGNYVDFEVSGEFG